MDSKISPIIISPPEKMQEIIGSESQKIPENEQRKSQLPIVKKLASKSSKKEAQPLFNHDVLQYLPLHSGLVRYLLNNLSNRPF